MANYREGVITPLFIKITSVIPTPIAVMNKSGDLVLMNSYFIKEFGEKIKIKHLQKYKFISVFIEPDKEAIKKTIKDCFRGKATKKNVMINGKTYIMAISPIKTPKIEFGLISMVDITKEEKTAKKLEHALEFVTLNLEITNYLQKFDIKDAFKHIIKSTRKNKKFGCIHIVQLDEKRNMKEVYFYSTTNQSEKQIREIYSKEYIEAMDKKGILILEDTTKGRFRHHKEKIKKHSGLSIAIKYRNKLYGILTLHYAPEVEIKAMEKMIFKEIADDIGQKFYRTEIEEQMKQKNRELNNYYFGFEKSGISRVFAEYKNKEPAILDVSNSFTELYGYGKEEVLGKNPRILQSGKTPLKTYKEMWKSILNPRVGHWQGEVKNKTKKGEEKIVLLTIDTIFDKKEPKYFFASHIDLTEKNRLINELQTAKEKIERIIENTGDIIYNIDNNNKITSINNSVKLYGYKPEELIGKNAKLLYYNTEKMQTLLHAIKQKGYVKNFETTLKTKDGRPKPSLITTYLTYDENGNVIGREGIIRDITQMKKAERAMQKAKEVLENEIEKKTKTINEQYQQLKQQYEQIENLQNVKDEFIRNMTHELKTPTSVILMNLELLKKIAPVGREKEWYNMLEMLQRNANRLSESINQILNLTRLQEIKLHYENVVLNDIIKQIYAEYLPIANRKGIDIKIKQEIVAIECDQELIKLAISNLVSNAIKFTNKGYVEVETRALDGHVQIIVRDTGIGMTEETKKHIFERFFKADPTAPGTGIGLSIVKQIIEKHNGRIDIKSEYGKGSEFIVTLPRRQTEKQKMKTE